MEAFLAYYPFCGLQCAAGKAFAAARAVAQGDGVGRGIETDFVRAGMCAGAVVMSASHLSTALAFLLFSSDISINRFAMLNDVQAAPPPAGILGWASQTWARIEIEEAFEFRRRQVTGGCPLPAG